MFRQTGNGSRSFTIGCVVAKSASSPALVAAVCAKARGVLLPWTLKRYIRSLLCYVQMQLSRKSPPALAVALSGNTGLMTPSTPRRQLMQVAIQLADAHEHIQV